MNVTQSPSASRTERGEGNVSNPASQDSLLSSQQSHQTRDASLTISQQFNSGTNNDQATPLSSYSNPSSQENLTIGKSGNAHGLHAPRDGGSATSQGVTSMVGYTEQAGGYKRTATGQIKSPSNRSLPPSPIGSNIDGHSRNSSMASRSSHIAEISNKLQARMSYAKVKVDHGWEGHSISELERMTSAQGSPVSASSYTARHATPFAYSPIDNPLHPQTPREASTSVPREYHHPAPRNHADLYNAGSLLNDLMTSGTGTMSIPKANETYEQFWQSHSNPASSSTWNSDKQPLNGRSLAPPVDFFPRATAPAKPKLPLPASSRFPGGLPSTPPTRTSTLANSRTSVEQDALEGLLSMNSPANSQNHSTSRPLLQSPLHGNFTEPSQLLTGIVNGNSMALVDPIQNANALGNLDDEELNKILDDMPDSSSDEDVVVKPRFTGEQLLRS